MDEIKATDVSDGVFKVVDEQGLEQATCDGWRLAKILPTTVMVGQRTEVVVIPAPTYGGGGAATTRDNFIPEYGMTHRFLVQLGHDEHVAELVAKIGRQAADLFDKTRAIRQLEETQKKMQADLDVSLRGTTAAKEAHERAATTCDQLRASVRKMELDLGKVRKDIGEKEFSRIVGGTT